MTQKVITKEELFKQLDSLREDFEVIGPKESANKGIFYETVAQADQLYLGEGFTVEPVKKFFFSPSEWLFDCQYKNGRNSVGDALLPDSKRIIIGVRPCEARGLILLDKVFNADEYKDEFYLNNRRSTAIIGLACAKPDRVCFCDSLGGSPIESRGMDAIIFAKAEEFIVEIITDKGQEIFGTLGQILNETQKASYALEKEKNKERVLTKIKAHESLGTIFENPYWQEVSRSCLSCGICTFLCPTCHCFDLVDEERKRMRCYDGCAFADFTAEASGENPWPTKRECYRQRVYHKFDYFKRNFGENLCVGCGRCIRHCPVKIDIAEIVDKAPLIQ
jgi:sulfhydrogenase subunit beta (sulfur reductase)